MPSEEVTKNVVPCIQSAINDFLWSFSGASRAHCNHHMFFEGAKYVFTNFLTSFSGIFDKVMKWVEHWPYIRRFAAT